MEQNSESYGTVVLDYDPGNCGIWESGWSPTKKLQVLISGYGIVLHRYNGHSTQRFIIESVSEQNEGQNSKRFSVTINFEEGVTFFQVLAQVELSYNEICSEQLNNVTLNSSNCPVDITLEYEFPQHSEISNVILHYNREIWKTASMNRIGNHANTVLKNGLKFPDKLIEKLEMLSADEQNRILVDFNKIHRKDASLYENQTSLFRIFHRNVIERGQKTALVQQSQLEQGHISLTYNELYTYVCTVASELQKRLETGERGKVDAISNELANENDANLNPLQNGGSNKNCGGSNVALFLPQGVSLIASTLAILGLNKTAAVLHSSYAKEQVESCLATLGFPILVTTPEKLDSIGLNYGRVFLVKEQEILESILNNNAYASIDFKISKISNKFPYCFFTSGSTGAPKAVIVSQDSILNRTNFCVRTCALDDSTRALCIVSPGFLPSLCDPWTTWSVGGSLHIPAESTRLDVEKLKRWIFEQEISSFFGSAAIVSDLLAGNEKYLSKVKHIFTAGERIREVKLANRKCTCWYSYGSTETFEICVKKLDGGKNHECPPVGPPISNVSVYVLDANCQVVPVGVTGDIYVSSVGLMAGYLNNTENGLVSNPFDIERCSQMYRTGDVGYWTEDGELCVLGRKDAQIKIHGMRLELGEVESVIQKFPGIKQTVVAVREIQNVKQMISYCRLQDGATQPSVKEIKAFLSTRLQRHAIPSEIFFVPDFPKTASGKLDRRASADLVTSRTRADSGDSIFDQIRHSWASTIGIPAEMIDDDSNFFSLGGNSMHAYKLTQNMIVDFPHLQISQIYKFPVLSDFVHSLSVEDFRRQDVDFSREISLDLNFDQSTLSPPKSIKMSLLTGSTGYFGPALLLQLLSTTAQTIVCIIRAQNAAEAEIKLEAAMEAHNFSAIFQKYQKSRLEILAGDLSLPLFGLEESIYQLLCTTVEAIYHAAAEVNHLKTYEQLRTSTVVMMRNVIEFATTRKTKWIHHMSSIVVFDGMRLPDGAESYTVSESHLLEDIEPSRMRNGYAQTKWVCEQLVRKAMVLGVPGVIYRLGEIGSHVTLSSINRDDALGSFLSVCRSLRQCPKVPCIVPYVSLDFAAKIVVDQSMTAAANSTAQNEVVHVIECEFSLGEFLEFDESTKYEAVGLGIWECNFNTRTLSICSDKERLGACAFLNTLKNGNVNQQLGFVLKNISFSCSTRASIEDQQKIGSSYLRALIA